MRWNLVCALPVVVMLAAASPASGADMKYPNWEANWYNPKATKAGVPWDPSKPMGVAQQAPLTEDAKLLLEASLKAQA